MLLVSPTAAFVLTYHDTSISIRSRTQRHTFEGGGSHLSDAWPDLLDRRSQIKLALPASDCLAGRVAGPLDVET